MNPDQRLKIESNYNCLVNELLVDDMTDNLFSDGVIKHDDLQRVHAERTDCDKARCLVNILIATENSFTSFLNEVNKFRPDLAEKVKNTDVRKKLEKGMLGVNVYYITHLPKSRISDPLRSIYM